MLVFFSILFAPQSSARNSLSKRRIWGYKDRLPFLEGPNIESLGVNLYISAFGNSWQLDSSPVGGNM